MTKKSSKIKSENKTKVYVRFRPANKREIEITQHLDVNDKNSYACEVCDESGYEQRKIMVNDSYKTREYQFDYAFSRYDTQANVYRNTTAPLIANLLQGKNSSLICYGQTGSGKTYTLFGKSDNFGEENHINDEDGIIVRAMDDLFYKMRQTEIPGEIEYQVEISFVQIYNEKVQDLLVPEQDNLTVRMVEEPMTGELDWGTSAAFLPVSSTHEIMEQVYQGLKNRNVRKTKMNNESSRSHALLKVRCRKLEINSGSVYTSIFNFVDLAGSEKISNSLVKDCGLREASYINKSLLHLKNVIKALSVLKKKQSRLRVIYRNSVLTKLLYQSLGGNSQSGLILCASPHVSNLRESLSTIQFGVLAKNIKSKPKVNYAMSIEELRRATGACIKRIEMQQIAILRKEREVASNKKLMLNVLLKLDTKSSIYQEMKRRFGHLFANLPENRKWGNMFVPEDVLLKIFRYTGLHYMPNCVRVCKDWKNFLLDDYAFSCNFLWKNIAIDEGYVKVEDADKGEQHGHDGYYRKIICEDLAGKMRRLREASRAEFAEQIRKIKGCNYSTVRLVV